MMERSNSTASVVLMRNVKDLRQRLVDTENTLKNITKLEAEVGRPLRTLEDTIDEHQSTESGMRSRASRNNPAYTLIDQLGRRGSNDDSTDRESIRSGVSTLPDSYTGFLSLKFPSSTPTRPQTKRQLSEDYDSDTTNLLYCETKSHNVSNTSRKLMRQNQRLLAEVEKLAYELQASKRKICDFSCEMDNQRDMVPELEDRIVGFQAEIDAADKALRSAEERSEDRQRNLVKMEMKMSQYQQEIEGLRNELILERKLRKKLESQRDEALQTFIDSQDSLEEYQRKMKDKFRKMEADEDRLRDSIAQYMSERDEAYEKLSSRQAIIEEQEDEIQRLQSLEAMDLETKFDSEQHNKDLRDKLTMITTRFNQLEGEIGCVESVRHENLRLKTQLQSQEQVLNQCQWEVEQSRTVLVQLEQLSQTSSANSSVNDSGLDSMNLVSSPGRYKSASSKSPSTNLSMFDSHSGVSNLASNARAYLADIRLKLSMKDAEIKRLHVCLQSRDRGNSEGVVDTLRAKMASLMESNEHGTLRGQEMENLICQLEADKSKLTSQLSQMTRDMTDRDAHTGSLEARLDQRNSQIIEFQEDLYQKCTEISNLERDLRKKTSKMSNLEEQLDVKMRELSAHIARMKQLEEELISHREDSDELRHQVAALQTELARLNTNKDKTLQLHKDQCQDYERQIERLQNIIEKNEITSSHMTRQVEQLVEEVASKNCHIEHLEKALKESQQEVFNRTQESREALQQLEAKASSGSAQIKQLESALLLCREEIQSYLSALDNCRSQFDREMSVQSQQLARLEHELQDAKMKLGEEREHSLDLDRILSERQATLQHNSSRLADLEQTRTNLDRQVSSLEQQLLREKAQSMTELEGLERKLHQACTDMQTKSDQVVQLTQTVKDMREEQRLADTEVRSLEMQVHEERAVGEETAARVGKLERENRDLRVQLEQKIELVSDMEDQLIKKAEDAQHYVQLISDLEDETTTVKNKLKESKAEIAKLDDQFQRSNFEVKAKDNILEDLRDALKKTQEELHMLGNENDELKEALDERQRELCERVTQVTQLDQTIKATHSEMEERMKNLDDKLHKYEMEIQDRTRQIVKLDDNLQQCQRQLHEKTLQSQQAEQLLQLNTMDLQAKSIKLTELEKSTERQHHQLNDQKEENVEITQELRLTREQLQQQHAEFMETRRELAQSHREQDRLARELEEAVATTHIRETQLRASEERESQTEHLLKSEIQTLNDDMAEIKQEHENEVYSSRQHQQEEMSSYQDLKAQLTKALQKLDRTDIDHQEELAKVKDDLDCLQNELISRKAVIDAANENIVLKDAEIARLHARISGYDRSVLTQMHAEKDKSARDRRRRVRPPESIISKPASCPVHGNVNMNTAVTSSVSQDELQGYLQHDVHASSSGAFDTDQFTQGVSQSNGTDVRLFQGILMDAVNGKSAPSHDPLQPVRPINVDVIEIEFDEHPSKPLNNNAIKQLPPAKRGDFPVVHDDPVTAVGMYEEPTTDGDSESDPEQCMLELHERLRSNALRQQEIERQLEYMTDEDSDHIETTS